MDSFAFANPPGIANPAVVFDFGGVLMDWDPRYLYRRYFGDDREAMEGFFTEVGFAEWNRLFDAGRPFAEGITELARRFPARRELIRAYDERWEETLAGPIRPTVAILGDLRRAGHKLYALSNWSAEKFGLVRSKHEFFSWFDEIVISGEVGLIKPDRRIFEALLARIGRAASECLFVDDAESNIAAAQDMGFRTIHFRSPDQLRMELTRSGLLG